MENQPPDDDAIRRNAHERLNEIVRRNERRAAALGITEEDIPRIVEEYRREHP
jgi:hypothetical protein